MPMTPTPAFNNWFGASKVVNADGAPLVVHHGTRAKFDVFKPTGKALGPHFGTLKSAEDRLASRALLERDGTAIIMPVTLAIQKPLRLRDLRDWTPWKIYDALRYGQLKKSAAAIPTPPAHSGDEQTYFAILILHLQSLGYDGTSYKNQFEDAGSRSWVPFDPAQIKLAVSQSDSFSRVVQDDDICTEAPCP